MSTLDKIIFLCKNNNISQKDLTSYLGLEKSTFSSWKSGKSSSYQKYISQISEFFNVPTSYFYDNDELFALSNDETNLLNDYRILSTEGKHYVLKVISNIVKMETSKEYEQSTITKPHSIYRVSAGTGYKLIDESSFEDIQVLKTNEALKSDFALTIDGDSMTPKYYSGDVVLVRSQPAVNVGEICIYNVAGDGYIKKFGGDRLISLNPKYDDILFSDYDPDEIKCYGLVLGKAELV